jgi:hypothetical protein
MAPLFLASALGEGEWLLSRPCRLNPGERVPKPTGSEAVWAPKSILTLWSCYRLLRMPGIEPQASSPHPDRIPAETVGLCVLLNNNQENRCFKITNIRYYAIETETILLQLTMMMSTYGRRAVRCPSVICRAI